MPIAIDRGGSADGQPFGINVSAPDAQRGSGPQADNIPEVPAASELFDDEAFRRLRDSRELAAFVEELRAREAQVVGRTESITRDGLLRAYAGIIVDGLSKVGLAMPVAAYSDAAGFCLGLLGQLKDAQEHAMDVFAPSVLQNR